MTDDVLSPVGCYFFLDGAKRVSIQVGYPLISLVTESSCSWLKMALDLERRTPAYFRQSGVGENNKDYIGPFKESLVKEILCYSLFLWWSIQKATTRLPISPASCQG